MEREKERELGRKKERDKENTTLDEICRRRGRDEKERK